MGQTVNLLSFDFGGSNPSLPTKREASASRFFFVLALTFPDYPNILDCLVRLDI